MAPSIPPSTHKNRYDVGQDGFLDLAELKMMMEKLGAPQTHLSLKKMIAEVDEDKVGLIAQLLISRVVLAST